ncbi:MAG: hypothetical protein FWD57_03560 [Polyangiaceae bacterium]|nr:hypothetical protein [Polyangiaceae bacterium]
MHFRKLVCLTAFASLLVACSSDSDNPPGGDKPDADTDADSSTHNSIPCDETDTTDLAGTWALLARYSLALQSQTGGAVNLCPLDQTGPATLLAVLDIEPGTGGFYDVTSVSCQLDLPQVSAAVGTCVPGQSNILTVEIPIPQRMINRFASVPPVQSQATLNSSALSLDPIAFAWGARTSELPSWQPSNPGCGANDTAPGHTSVCEESCVDHCDKLVDDDEDGFPGITVNLCGRTEEDVRSDLPCNAEDPTTAGTTLQGVISMSVYTQITMQGTPTSSCEASGTFASNTGYTVVGADAYLTGGRLAVASVILSLPTFQGKTNDSTWHLVRVDGKHGAPNWNLPQGASEKCAIVRNHRNELE